MSNIYKNREEMAKEAFFLNDILMGALSGGIDVPRKVKGVVAYNTPRKSHYHIRYTYQSGYYTDLREGKDFTDEYTVDSNGNIALVGDKLFAVSEDDSFYDLCKPYIDNFHEKWNNVLAMCKNDRKEVVL